eukprot:TRINITY_DN23677_c0_g1_i1.p1 TRINITY_DN23677_c0_g1~~TRINITY_DN23677_c0_g1_i1.p1  ORF type:complete len:607 (-),score=91.72 TRINITY_DN23677_c0_g1_i1:20-1840(-)
MRRRDAAADKLGALVGDCDQEAGAVEPQEQEQQQLCNGAGAMTDMQRNAFRQLLAQHSRDVQKQVASHELRMTELLEMTFGASEPEPRGLDRTWQEDDFFRVMPRQLPEGDSIPPLSQTMSECAKSTATTAIASIVAGGGTATSEVSKSGSPNSRRKVHTMKLLRQVSRLDTWQQFIRSRWDMAMGVIVVVNIMVMIAELEVQGRDADASLGKQPANSQRANNDLFQQAEYVFFIIYVADIAFRVGVLRSEWLMEAHTRDIVWVNIFDAIVVFINALELCVFPFTPLHDSEVQSNVGNVKVMKLIRISRVLRVVRTSRIFGQLRMLLATCLASMGAFAWSVALLFLFQVSFSLIISQLLHSTIVDSSNDVLLRQWLNDRYGSFFKSLYTMFEITYSGGWPSLVRRVVEEVTGWYAILFLAYITFVVFAVIRVITALFIKETLSCASDDAELAMEEKRKTAEAFQSKLEVLFESMDMNADGFLSHEEVQAAVENPALLNFLSTLELQTKDLQFIFQLLDDGDGLLTLKEFCLGLTRLKGAARAYDFVVLLHEQYILRAFCHEIYTKLNDLCISMGMKRDSSVELPRTWTSSSRKLVASKSARETMLR